MQPVDRAVHLELVAQPVVVVVVEPVDHTVAVHVGIGVRVVPGRRVLVVEEVEVRVLRLLGLVLAVVLGGPPLLGHPAADLVPVAQAVGVGVTLVVREHAVLVDVERPAEQATRRRRRRRVDGALQAVAVDEAGERARPPGPSARRRSSSRARAGTPRAASGRRRRSPCRRACRRPGRAGSGRAACRDTGAASCAGSGSGRRPPGTRSRPRRESPSVSAMHGSSLSCASSAFESRSPS